jgi:hypothetical protein
MLYRSSLRPPPPHPPLSVMRLLLRSAVRRLQGALHAVASLPQVTLLVSPHPLVAVTAVGTCSAVCPHPRFLQALCSSILPRWRHVAETDSLVAMAHIRVVLPIPCNVLCPTHCLSSCSPDFSLHLHIRTASPSSFPYVVSQPKWEQAVRSVLRKDEHVVFAVIGFWVRLRLIYFRSFESYLLLHGGPPRDLRMHFSKCSQCMCIKVQTCLY